MTANPNRDAVLEALARKFYGYAAKCADNAKACDSWSNTYWSGKAEVWTASANQLREAALLPATAPWPCLACAGDGGHREGCLGDLHLREAALQSLPEPPATEKLLLEWLIHFDDGGIIVNEDRTEPWYEENLIKPTRAALTTNDSKPVGEQKEGAERGWLLERDNNGPEWLGIERSGAYGEWIWTKDSMKALRFARRKDADNYACFVEEAWSIKEHQWG